MDWLSFIKKNKFTFIIISLFFILTLTVTYHFLSYIETREGADLNDPILLLFESKDVSWLLFVLTYLGSIIGIVYCLLTPERTVLAILTYSFLLWFRMLCMYLTPLNPPNEIIPLRDIFLELTFYSGQPKLKDLFFSGHTATMFMFFILSENKILKYIFLTFSIMIGILVLIQHAHYTIDVVIAPVASYLAYIISKKIKQKYFDFSCK